MILLSRICRKRRCDMGKTGLVLEGGALRGIFTAGVLDFLMEKNIEFPYVIGVSAGAGNAMNYVSRQPRRSKQVITHENQPSYYGMGQLFENKKVLNLDTLVVEYALKDFPFDFDTFYASETECECVALNCETGLPVYFSDFRDNDHLLKANMASCAVPFICEPVEIDGGMYLDGSLMESVPAKRAMDKGCDKVVVVLTREAGAEPTDYAKMKKLVELCYKRKYPNLCTTILKRKENYEKQMEYLKRLEQEGKAFIIRPQTQAIRHFENDYNKLCAFYDRGYTEMQENFAALQKFLGEEQAASA